MKRTIGEHLSRVFQPRLLAAFTDIHTYEWRIALPDRHRILLSLLVVSLLLYTCYAFQVYLPCLTLPIAADDPAAQPILAALNKGYDTLGLAYRTRDVKVLATAFIDHPVYRWKLGCSRSATLRSFINKVMGPASVHNFGELTAMQNKLTYRIHGDQVLRAKLAEGDRDLSTLTAAEWQALAEQNFGERPSLFGEESTSADGATHSQVEKLYDLHLCSSKAEFSYSDYITGHRAILIQQNGAWFIAGIYK